MDLIKFNTNLTDVAAGAAAGAVANHFMGSGEKKLQQGAMLGALIVVVMPTFAGAVAKVMPKKAAA